jgi:hypothetical protein
MAASAAGFQSLHTPFAAADRARFFKSWLRRIAPDTHQDQARGDVSAARPSGFAAPEERWCRTVSNGFMTDPWLPNGWPQSLAGSRCERSERRALLFADNSISTIHSQQRHAASSTPYLPLGLIHHFRHYFFHPLLAKLDVVHGITFLR